MATFSLQQRHHQEAQQAARTQARIATETGTTTQHPNDPRPQHAGGDPRYRIPAIGLNPGAIPGTRPDQQR